MSRVGQAHRVGASCGRTSRRAWRSRTRTRRACRSASRRRRRRAASESIVLSSSPPNPAPSTTTRSLIDHRPLGCVRSGARSPGARSPAYPLPGAVNTSAPNVLGTLAASASFGTPEQRLPAGQRGVVVVVGRAHRARFDERREQHRADPAAAGPEIAGQRRAGARRLFAARLRLPSRARLVEDDLEQPVALVGGRARDLRHPRFQERVDVGQRRGAARLVRARVVVAVFAQVRRDEREARASCRSSPGRSRGRSRRAAPPPASRRAGAPSATTCLSQ